MADNKRLCTVEPHLPLKSFPPPAGLEPQAISRLAVNHLSYRGSYIGRTEKKGEFLQDGLLKE